MGKSNVTIAAIGDGRSSNLADIADAAGVSISTVSRALSGSGGVSVATTRRIVDLAEGLSYHSRGASVQAARLHCLLPMELFDADPAGFYRELIQSITSAADSDMLEVAVSFVESQQDLVPRIKELARTELLNGFFLVSIDDTDVHAAAAEAGAAVLVNVAEPSLVCDAVTPANRAGAYFATRHLLDLGHRRIAHLTWGGRATIRERFAGYRKAMEDAGLQVDPDLVLELNSMTPQDGAKTMRATLAAQPFDSTAILCPNDMVAIGVISALEAAGRSVPKDCSVMGFDNTSITARHSPALTTMEVDLQEVGREAVRLMRARILKPERSAVFTQIGCRLITRETTLSAL